MYTLLITFFLVSIVFSFLCSLWEAVLLSVTPAYAQIKMREGGGIGRQLQAFKENIDRPLAAILTLNTVAHTMGAIGVGVQASRIWEETSPFVTSVIVPVVMTLTILILSEIIPKTIGANQWKMLAPFTVRSLQILIVLLYPFVWLSQLITRALKRDKSRAALTRAEFLAMAEIGAEQGVFESRESEIIGNLLRLDSVRARDIMTPRTVVRVASEQTTLRAFFNAHPEGRFSRVPVHAQDSRDHITGYFLKDEMLAELVGRNDEKTLGEIKRAIVIVPENLPLPQVFTRLTEKREHIALVVDEFGGMAGIVTMEDVIETLLGMEIIDESDRTEDMQAMARKAWERRARALGLVD